MSKASQKQRALDRPALEATWWKAERDTLSKTPSGYRGLKSTPGARWRHATPFADYKPITGKREPSPGPHAMFLKLKGLLSSDQKRFRYAADLFASRYGLLGLFHLDYFPPTLPAGKVYVAPEAVIDKDGQLRSVDPTCEGLELLERIINAHFPSHWSPFAEEQYEAVAMPEEISFVPKDFFRSADEPVPSLAETVPWTKAREYYDAVLVLDPSKIPGIGVSILVKKESTLSWVSALRDFPSPPYTNERLPSLIAYVVDEMRITGVQHASSAREGQNPNRGWCCNTLLGSLYLMLYLDLIGNVDLKRCSLPDCGEYFRPGAQSSSYCRPAHTNLASSRAWLAKQG